MIALRWALHRQAFFIKQRLFASASACLLDNQVSGRLRARLLARCGARVGKRCSVRGGLRVQENFNFELADDVFINAGCCLDGAAPVRFGAGVQVGYQATFITGGHAIGTPERRAGTHRAAPIAVGPGAWIGARAVILPGVTIGAGAVVAAGAVVTKDVDADTLVAGVPALPLRQLDGDRERAGWRDVVVSLGRIA